VYDDRDVVELYWLRTTGYEKSD